MSPVLAPATPRLTVQYGSFTIDATNKCVLSSEYDGDDTDTDGSFYVEFNLQGANTGNTAADDAAWSALVQATETALRIPRQTLLVELGGTNIRNWCFAGGVQTAILIRPELILLEDNARDHRYGFRVRCQFPGNVPGNVFRRESLTTNRDTLRENRATQITASWTSSNGVTAYARYIASSGAFFAAYLPANSVDHYGTTGTWVRADEDPHFNDEDSVITATANFWEVFAGRRDSATRQSVTIGNQRVEVIPVVYVASNGFTALQNYTNNGGAFFDAALPSTSGAWVVVDETFQYNDQNGELTATRTYHETFNGLREYAVNTTTDESDLRTLVVAGCYYNDGTSAKANYTANINALIAAAVAAETPSIAHYESHSTPKLEGYDQNGLRYNFRWTIKELAYPQNGTIASPTWDDPNIRLERLSVDVDTPYDAFSLTAANPTITWLRQGQATFDVNVGFQANQDPAALWVSSLRAHVLDAIKFKLGATLTVHVTFEKINPRLHNNTLTGILRFVVTGGSVLRLHIVQRITQWPGRRFVGRADGANYSYRAYRKPCWKRMHREGMVEYVVGTGPPVLFGAGDNVTSGFGLIDTGITAQASVDALNASGTLSLPTNGWFIDPDAPAPYSYTDDPTTLGDGSGLQTVRHFQAEDWFFISALEPGS